MVKCNKFIIFDDLQSNNNNNKKFTLVRIYFSSLFDLRVQ